MQLCTLRSGFTSLSLFELVSAKRRLQCLCKPQDDWPPSWLELSNMFAVSKKKKKTLQVIYQEGKEIEVTELIYYIIFNFLSESHHLPES